VIDFRVLPDAEAELLHEVEYYSAARSLASGAQSATPGKR